MIPMRYSVTARLDSGRSLVTTVNATSEASARFRALDRWRALGYTSVCLGHITDSQSQRGVRLIMNGPRHNPTAPSRIGISNHIAVHRWTWDAFLKYVQYEAMFYDSCIRVAPLTDDTNARFMMRRSGPGHNGFPTDVTQCMVLFDVDGDVPPFTGRALSPDAATEDYAYNGDTAAAERRARYAASAE